MAVVLVTGTSSGIELATAVTLARGGHAVIATMRNMNGASELRKIVSEEKLPVEVVALNVDDDASVRDAIGKALAERGHIDVLVNNAGVGGGGAVEEVSMDFFRQTMETNFFGALRCIKAVNQHARTPSGLHHQCDVGRGPRGNSLTGTLRRLQIRS
jgi:NAD(P)-dependent dehydrogenase (short-subunit alcohol dehydrogenase family)